MLDSKNIIPILKGNGPRKNWFLVYSYMLSPEDEDIQNDIFKYQYYYWCYRQKIKGKKSGLNFKNENVLGFLFDTSRRDGPSLYSDIIWRSNVSRIAGRLLRVIRSLSNAEHKISPSIFNAIKIYRSIVMKHSSGNDYYSETNLKKYRSSKADVLHYCAAYTVLDPMKKSDQSFENRFIKFLAIAKNYRSFAQNFRMLRQKKNSNEMLINPLSVFSIPSVYDLPAIDASDLGLSSFEEIIGVDVEEELSPPGNLS